MLQRTSTPTSPAATRPRPAHTERKGEPSRLFPTRNDLPEATRERIADLLNQQLADCIDLQTQCKQAHWNVKGRSFIGLHKLFDEINDDVEEYVDLLAERVVQLGGIAQGTARTVASRSSLPEYASAISSGEAHVEALSTALASFGSGVRKTIQQAAELQDDDTADILTEVSRGIDKWLWFVEAHQQGRE